MRPEVTTSNGATLDGRVLDWYQPIDPKVFPGLADPGLLGTISDYDVVLTGADTLWPFPGNPVMPGGIDRPPASAPPAEDTKPVPAAPGGRWLAITDSRGRLPDDWFTSFLSGGTVPPWPGGPTDPLGEQQAGRTLLMLVSETTPKTYLAYLRTRGIAYLTVGQERVDLAEALAALQDQLSVERVFVDGGSKLHHALLAGGLVDRVHVNIAPVILGTRGMTIFQVEGLALPEGRVLNPIEVQVRDNGVISALYGVRT